MTAPSKPARLAFGLSGDLDFTRAPLTLAWEITRACHLRCVHCRAEAQPRPDPRELTNVEGLGLIEQAAAMGVKVLVITGGDPLMRADVFELIRAVRATGMHCGFSPSVTRRLTRDALARAVDAGAASIHLSLDGASAAAHDGFRGVPGSFERTLAAIEHVSQLGARLQIGTTVSRQTVSDLPDIPSLIAGRASVWSLFFLVPTGRAQRDAMLNAEQHEQTLVWLATTPFAFPIRTIAAPALRRVLAQHGCDPGPAVTDGDGFAFVSHTGQVYPSGFLQLAAGSVRDQPLAAIYRDHPLFLALRDRAQLRGRCGACDYRAICGGSRARAWALTGDPFAAEPTCAYLPGAAHETPRQSSPP